MTLTPWDWQLVDQANLAAHNYTGAVVIEPGGAKTMLACLAGINSGAQIKLIVAPQGTHRGHGDGYEWHVKELTGEQVQILNNGSKPGKLAFSDLRFGVPGWYLITPQLFARTDWHGIHIDMAVVDECHLILQGKKSRKALLGINKNRPGLQATHRILMSGTPVRNKFQNWWPAMRWLYPAQDGYGQIADASEMRWKDYRMVSEYDFFAYNNKKYSREKIPGQLASEIPCFVQHFRRAACCAHHPNGFLTLDAPNVVEEVVPLLPEQRRAIRELEEQSLTYLGDNPLVTELEMTTQLRIRQITLGVPSFTEEGELDFADDCASPKLDRMLELLDDLVDEQVVVFTSSQKFARVAALRLNQSGVTAFEWSGAIPQGERDKLMPRFQTGEFRVAVVSIAAGGTGVGGFSKASATEIWLDRDLDPTNTTQAEARLDRLGAKAQVQRFFLHDDEGYDEGRLSAQIEKRLELNASNRRKVPA